MVGELENLALLPLRIGVRVTLIALRPVAGVLRHVLGADGDRYAVAVPEREPARPGPEPAPAPPPPDVEEPYVAAEPEPEHVSEEPVLVAESADSGAEEGVGAQLSVAEPWDGYRQMKAADIVDRIAAADPEELAVVQLYEMANRRRKTVLEAAARRLKAESGPASRG